MASYQWLIRGTQRFEESFYTDTSTNTKKSLGFFWKHDIQPLQEVDSLICAVMKEPVNKMRYNPWYNELTELAFAALMKFGGQFIETHHVMWMESLINKAKTIDEAEKIRYVMLVRWAFLDKWKFEAWR